MHVRLLGQCSAHDQCQAAACVQELNNPARLQRKLRDQLESRSSTEGFMCITM
jgi:hypothetical protein